MSAPTVTDPNAARPGISARLRSASIMGRRLLQHGSQVLWATPKGESGSNWPRWRSIGVGAAIVVVATGVSLFRQPGAGALDTIWAEDGEVFLSAAASTSWVDSIRMRYAGYFHLGPRVLAELATVVPPAAAAATLAILAALSTALLAVLVYVASAGHLHTRVARTLAAAVVVVAPLASDEVPNSIANLQWPGLFALFWMLLWTPRALAGRIVAAAVTFVVATSSILAVVFLPLSIARVVWTRREGRRDRHALVLASLLAAGVGLQVIGVIFGSSERGLAPDPVLAVTGFLVRAVPSALMGDLWLPASVNAAWLAIAAVAWLLVAAVVVGGLRRRGGRPNWELAGIAFAHAAAVYALPVLLSGYATPRYALPAALLLVTAIVAVLEPDTAGVSPVALWAFAAVLAVVCAVNLRVDNLRADGPTWSEGLRAAQQECAEHAPGTVRVTIPPRSDRGWVSTLPCDYVRR
jgi:hypothetical protein